MRVYNLVCCLLDSIFSIFFSHFIDLAFLSSNEQNIVPFKKKEKIIPEIIHPCNRCGGAFKSR